MGSIIVTGGAGYIGSHVVREALNAGHEVTVLDNLELGHVDAVPNKAGFHRVDLNSLEEVCRIFNDVEPDSVVHLAAYSQVGESMRDPRKYYGNNLGGTSNLVKACALAAGKIRVVFSSTAATYGDPLPYRALDEGHPTKPINPYGQSKLFAENLLQDAAFCDDLRVIALRYFNAAGADASGDIGEDHHPETHLIPLALAAAMGKRGPLDLYGNDFPTTDGTGVRDYVHVTDLAKAHLLALDHLKTVKPNCDNGFFDVMNVGTGRGTSVMEVLKAVETVTGTAVPYNVKPRRAGDPEVLVATVDKIRRVLNWVPQVTNIVDIVRSAYHWMQRHPDGYEPRVTE